MINIKRITLVYPKDCKNGHNTECYAIVTHGENSHYCKTVVGCQGMFEWVFDKEILKLALSDTQSTIKLKLLDYTNCKTLDEFEVEASQLSSSSKIKTISNQFTKENGKVGLQIEYLSQNRSQPKRAEQMNNYDRVSKRTSTTNYEETTLLPSVVQKVTSSKLIPSRQVDYYNFGPYYSPKNTPDYYMKAYRQYKQAQSYESLLLRKSGSYKFLL